MLDVMLLLNGLLKLIQRKRSSSNGFSMSSSVEISDMTSTFSSDKGSHDSLDNIAEENDRHSESSIGEKPVENVKTKVSCYFTVNILFYKSHKFFILNAASCKNDFVYFV